MPTFDLSRRRREPEIMDQPGLNDASHRQALRGLARINGLSRSASMLWPIVQWAADQASPRPAKVMDLACGGGDVIIDLARRARRAGLNVQFDACDVSPVAVQFAAAQARRAGVNIGLSVVNVIDDPLPQGYDLFMNSLFLHHLPMPAAIHLLAAMRAVPCRHIAVNDLVRSPMGLAAAWAGTRLLSRSPIVHVDGPRSVRAAFTLEEMRDMARQAGLERATVEQRPPWRMLLSWRRP